MLLIIIALIQAFLQKIDIQKIFFSRKILNGRLIFCIRLIFLGWSGGFRRDGNVFALDSFNFGVQVVVLGTLLRNMLLRLFV